MIRLSFASLMALVALVLPALARAQVRSEVDARKVGVQDAIQWTITVEGSSLPDQIPLPPLSNLRLVGGPATSTQMSFINGRASQARSWTYALQPTGVGRAEIGAVRLRLESGEVTAPAIAIEVVAGSVKPQRPARRQGGFFDEDPFGTMGRGRAPEPKVFVEAKPSRGSLHVGEPLLLTYYLYTQASISGLQFSNAPQYTGFWAEDLPAPERPPGEPATVDGEAYRRFPIMLKLLFPTKAGRLTIPTSSLKIGIARQSFFDNGGVVERATKPVTVEVKPIPDEPGFSGAVGRFTATTTVDRSSVALGEAATLRFKVEGSGNLKWVERAPEVAVPGAKVYPPQAKTNLQTRPSGIVGSRTWEYVVVPQTSGTLEIPSLDFTYFDPGQRRIVHSATPPLPLRVEGGAPGAAIAPSVGRPVAARGGPLPLRAELDRGASHAIPGRVVGGLALAALLIHGLLWGGDRIASLRRPGMPRAASTRDVRGALGELQRIGRGGMSKEAAAGLIEKTIRRVFGPLDGDDSERARNVRELLDQVHEVRYAPQLGDYSEKLRELAARADQVVRRWA